MPKDLTQDWLNWIFENIQRGCDRNELLDILLKEDFDLTQSKIALGSGGATGKGFLEGTQSYLEYLPEKQTDFIFTLIGEEFGFLGTMFIIFTFVLLIAVCYFISIKCFHTFGRILALGVASNVFIYVFMNIAMVSGLMPVVGIPLPLISYGGSVMLSIMTVSYTHLTLPTNREV